LPKQNGANTELGRRSPGTSAAAANTLQAPMRRLQLGVIELVLRLLLHLVPFPLGMAFAWPRETRTERRLSSLAYDLIEVFLDAGVGSVWRVRSNGVAAGSQKARKGDDGKRGNTQG
jgi:hypothetical protein